MAGVLTYNSTTRQAVFNPENTLKKTTIYIVTVSGARDASGNVMTTRAVTTTLAGSHPPSDEPRHCVE